MDSKELLTRIWNLEQVERPALILEEPEYQYQPLDPDASLEGIFQNRYQKYLALKGHCRDHLETLDCVLGTHVIACAFGAQERIFEDGHRYIEKPIITCPADVDHLRPADLKAGPLGKQIEILKYFADRTKGEIPIRIGDIQNPLGVAEMLWETEDFYTSLYEAPEQVHKLLDMITEVVIEYASSMLEIGEQMVPIAWPLVWAPKGKGIYLADDTMSMLSPDMYEEFGVFYNNRISDAFGGIMFHSCVINERYFDKIAKNKNLRSINFAAQYSSDMSKIFSYFGGKAVIMPHYVHTDNPQIGTVEEFIQKVFTCWTPQSPCMIYVMENPDSLSQANVLCAYQTSLSKWNKA